MIRRMWHAAPAATVLLGAALAAILFFGIRLGADWLYWNDPAHRDQNISGWMTPRYVAMSWDVPRPVMIEILDLQPREGRPMNLRDLAEERGMTLAELVETLESGIQAFRAGQGSSE